MGKYSRATAPGKRKTPYARKVAQLGRSADSPRMPDRSINQFLANQMRELRRRHHLTQEQAAALIGCDYKYYQTIEAGGKDLRLSMLNRLAKPFGLRTEQLFLDPIPPTTIAEPPPAKQTERP